MESNLINSCDVRVSNALVPSTPVDFEVNDWMDSILKEYGIDYCKLTRVILACSLIISSCCKYDGSSCSWSSVCCCCYYYSCYYSCSSVCSSSSSSRSPCSYVSIPRSSSRIPRSRSYELPSSILYTPPTWRKWCLSHVVRNYN